MGGRGHSKLTILLDILKFIEVTEFELNKVMFDYFSTNWLKASSYDMLAFGQHGVASCCRKHFFWNKKLKL